MTVTAATLRVLEPAPGLFAYYDGRIEGRRLHGPGPNWLDDGAYVLGTASYAIVAGAEALVYDTHMSLAHARAIRAHLEGRGVTAIRVALSHWHKDHVAGNAVFADGEIVALGLTRDALMANRIAIETGDPPIAPLVPPTRCVAGVTALDVGPRRVELHPFVIHSHDGAVLWLPDERLLLAGDTLEDTVTYVAEPDSIPTHIAELARLRAWPIHRILPNHGDPDRIAAGGYAASLVDANRAYLQRLLDPAARARGETLRAFVAAEIATGAVTYCNAYEEVHRRNVAVVEGVGRAELHTP